MSWEEPRNVQCCFLRSGLTESILALNAPHCPFQMLTDNCFQKSLSLRLSSARSSLFRQGHSPADYIVWPQPGIRYLTNSPTSYRVEGELPGSSPALPVHSVFPPCLSCPLLLQDPGDRAGWEVIRQCPWRVHLKVRD